MPVPDGSAPVVGMVQKRRPGGGAIGGSLLQASSPSFFVILIFCLLRHAESLIGFRPRPMFDPQCSFGMPSGLNVPNPASYWGRSNTFPSGHAAILAVFTVGLMYVSRPAGAFCLVYSLLICSIRRLFLRYSLSYRYTRWCMYRRRDVLFCEDGLVGYVVTRRVLTWSNTSSLFVLHLFLYHRVYCRNGL